MPNTGARLIVASDGVWDGFENMKRLSKLSRGATCQVNVRTDQALLIFLQPSQPSYKTQLAIVSSNAT